MIEIPFSEMLGVEVFKSYHDFYLFAIDKAIVGQTNISVLELGCDLGFSARLFVEKLDEVGLPYNIKFVDINYRVEMASVIDNERTFFIHSRAEDCVGQFEDNSLDIIHIDLDPHTYEQAQNTFNLYNSKLKSTGVFLFHDASPIQFTVHDFLANELQPVSGWMVEFCDERPPFPQAAPAMVYRIN